MDVDVLALGSSSQQDDYLDSNLTILEHVLLCGYLGGDKVKFSFLVR